MTRSDPFQDSHHKRGAVVLGGDLYRRGHIMAPLDRRRLEKKKNLRIKIAEKPDW